jgi:dehydrodolichyl diphosphate syntase complex subunit NUS1
LPVHISLVVVEDDISLTDIARLVAWSMVAGIAYVTIYDHKGRCKQNRSLLLNQVSEEERQMNGGAMNNRLKNGVHHGSSKCSAPFQSLDTSLLQVPDVSDTSLGSNSCKNPHVFIVGPDNGRQGLVAVAKQLSVAIAMQRLLPCDITVPYVDSIIHGVCGFPDPDLVLKFGRVESVLGFLPWHLRLTEIISLPSHHGIRLQQFINAIVYFGNTEQRFGK